MTRGLSPQEEQAIVLDRKGLRREEIAEQLMISDDHLYTVFRRAVAKGYEIPGPKRRKPPTGVYTQDLLATREKLRAEGIVETPEINRLIAERFGLAYATVRMRLLRHDRAERRV